MKLSIPLIVELHKYERFYIFDFIIKIKLKECVDVYIGLSA